MLWLKVVSALESALLFTSQTSVPDGPGTRTRRTSDGAAAHWMPATRSHDDGNTGAGDAEWGAQCAPCDPWQDVAASFPSREHRFFAPGDATHGAGLLRLVDQAGAVPPGRGVTGRALPRPPAPSATVCAEAACAGAGVELPGTPRGLAFLPLSGTATDVMAPERATVRPRTVWTHELLHAAGNLTRTVWQESRASLGDDRWTSAGIAAWWGLQYMLDSHEAASMLHRARALAYDAFDISAREHAGWAQLHARERTMLNAWVHTRSALKRIGHGNASAETARALLMQIAERECHGDVEPATPETLYLLVTADHLALRVDVDAIRRRYGAIWNPSLALKIAAYLRDTVVPSVASPGAIDALPAAVQRAMDEAALLFFNVQRLYEIDFIRQRITVLSGIAHYLSHGGPRPFTQEMRVLDAVVALLAGATGAARQASLYRDRGAVVWLTDRILEESGYDTPRRLNRAVLFETYGTHYRNALNEFARARWAAEIEDRYIAGALIDL
ncbi:MAG: hypothetical protein ACRYHA_22765 [Janthinobacterium lividum]